jgi:hypothetical protein
MALSIARQAPDLDRGGRLLRLHPEQHGDLDIERQP